MALFSIQSVQMHQHILRGLVQSPRAQADTPRQGGKIKSDHQGETVSEYFSTTERGRQLQGAVAQIQKTMQQILNLEMQKTGPTVA